jgi:HEAT repeat protein
MISLQRTRFSETELNTWLTDEDESADSNELLISITPTDDHETSDDSRTSSQPLEEALNNGFLLRFGSIICFSHPIILGYLASRSVTSNQHIEMLFDQPSWFLKELTLRFLLPQYDIDFDNYISIEEDEDDLLLRKQLRISRWLPHIPSNIDLRKKILKFLTMTLRDDQYPMGTRMSALTAIAVINDPDVNSMFRHLLKSKSSSARKLAALGCGYSRDPQSVNDLVDMINDLPSVSQSACLALVNIGSKPALDAIASTLLHGNEQTRISAAEALANHPEEGHKMLREGANIDDLLLRRAVVHGLKRIDDPWAIELLENIQIEDDQWVVRNTAQEILEIKDQPDPHIPHPKTALEETPWLIAFASDRGLGVSPGRPARNMLLTALKEGNEPEQLAAMYYIRQVGEGDALPILYRLIFSDSESIKNAAYTTLWQLESMGIDIPSSPS